MTHFTYQMIKNIYATSVPVKDQDKALAFYTEKLGWKLVCDESMPNDSQRWIEVEIPGGQTRIALHTPKGQEGLVGNFSNIAYATDDLQKTVENLKQRGVKFTQEITKVHWGHFAIFSDVDGNEFCIGQAA